MKKVGFMKTILRFLEPALHDKPKLFFFSLTFIIWKMYEIANVFAFAEIVKSIQSLQHDRFISIIIYFTSFIIIYQVVNFYHYKFFGFYELAMYRYINERYLPRLIEIDNNHIESLGSGKVMTIFTKGMDYWSQFTEKLISRSIGIIVMLGYTAYMFTSVSWKYFILLLGVNIGFNIFAVLFRNIGIKYRVKMYDMVADYNRKVLRFIMSKHEVMQNNKAETEAKNIGNFIGEINQVARIRWPYEHFSFNSMEVGVVLVKTAVMYGIGNLVFGGSVQIGEFVGMIALLGYLSSTTQGFVDMIKDYVKNGVNLRRFWEFLDTAPKIHNLYVGKSYVHTKGDISIQDVTYAYEKKNIFENFSLHIEGGKKTAFVGASGSGKTTLIKLIAGYLSPQQGDVCIDENCLSETKLIEYYKKIGYLTQEPSIFDGTVYENLIYALDEIPDNEHIHQVIRDAKCEFIYEFPDGVATEIGERGIRLSGGQRQRLAIAKIMLKNPDIVLLDEPTSALDSFNEEQISIALHNLFRQKTVIIVAHRLQTVKNADQILVFEDGKVVEQGSHDELIKLGARYNRLLELQSGFNQ